MPRKRVTIAQERRIGRSLYRQYCAGATWDELRRWYGRYGLTEPLLWRLMIAGVRPGECCSLARS